jgi:dienelactone hydrolase
LIPLIYLQNKNNYFFLFFITKNNNNKAHAFIIEYPGYGVYKSKKDHKKMLADSLITFDFLEKTLGFPPENIYIFGRSIGTGPASYLASQRPRARMLILLSPYTNLKAVAKDLVGFLSVFFKDRFNNLKCMKDVKSPTIIIHGKKDDIIKVEHSNKLFDALKIHEKRLIQPYAMTHNYFKLYEDLIIPIYEFEKELISQNRIANQINNFPDSLCLEYLEFYKSSKLYQDELALKNQAPSSFSATSKIKNKTKKKRPDFDETRRQKRRPKKDFQKKSLNKSDGNEPRKKLEIFEENKTKMKQPPMKKVAPPKGFFDDATSEQNYDFPEHKRLGEFGGDPFGQGDGFGYPRKMG